jgi:hypothetical protein
MMRAPMRLSKAELARIDALPFSDERKARLKRVSKRERIDLERCWLIDDENQRIAEIKVEKRRLRQEAEAKLTPEQRTAKARKAAKARTARERRKAIEAERYTPAGRRLQRELGLQLIDIGWKALAKSMHPDRGGSAEDMARLNRVRDQLIASA